MNQINGHEIALSWDAGGKGCGQLVIGLRKSISRLEVGQVMKIIASDAGAQVDIPAWCRISGNPLLSSNHPEYFIQRTGD